METLSIMKPGQIEDLHMVKFSRFKLTLLLTAVLLSFLLSGVLIQQMDARAGVLDNGILSLFSFGVLLYIAAICSSVWLQHLLWDAFKNFHKEFDHVFKQLKPWQQCKLYFSVFFLFVFAFLWALANIL